MKLYQLPYSHFSAKVRIVILEKKLIVELPNIPGGSQDSADYRQINPTGLVPCFVDNDWVLSESEVIVEYLEEQYPDNAMLPKSPQPRAKSRWLSRMHDLNIAPRLTELYGLSLSNNPDGQQCEQALAELHSQLNAIEQCVKPAPFFFHEQFGISDASFVLSYWYATLLSEYFGNSVDEQSHPKLAEWFTHASARQSSMTVLEDCKRALGMADNSARKAA